MITTADLQTAMDTVASGGSPADPPVDAPPPDTAPPPTDPQSAGEPAPDPAPPVVPDPAPPEPPAPPAEPPMSDAMLRILDKERDLYHREQRANEAVKKAEAAAGMLELAKSDPIKFAEQHLPQNFYETWTQRILNGGKATDAEAQQQILSRVEAAEARAAQVEQAAQQREHRKSIDNHLDQVEVAFDSDDSFEMAKSFPNVREVSENLLNSHYQQTGKVLTPVEIAETIRDKIVHTMYTQLSKTGAAKKIWQELSAETHPSQATPPGAEPATQAAPAAASQPSLTNDLDSSSEYALPDDLSWDQKLLRMSKKLVMPGD